MERNESVLNVEKANYEGGLQSAYDAFSKEVNKITSSNSQADAEQKIETLAAELDKKGLLDDISAYWAMQNKTLMHGDGKFSREELRDYVDGNQHDKVATTLGNAMKAQYTLLKDNQFGWLDDGEQVEGMDLLNKINDFTVAQKQQKAKESVSQFADAIKADPKLFKMLASLDGVSGNISRSDLEKAKENIEQNAKLGKQNFTPEQIKAIQNVDFDSLPRIRGGSVTEASLKTAKAYVKHEWELPAPATTVSTSAEASAEVKPVPEVEAKKGMVEGLTAGIENVAELAVDGLQAPPLKMSSYEIKAGQGFDRIARDILRKEQALNKDHTFNEMDVLDLSDKIARANNMKRTDMLRLDKKTLEIPPLNWEMSSSR